MIKKIEKATEKKIQNFLKKYCKDNKIIYNKHFIAKWINGCQEIKIEFCKNTKTIRRRIVKCINIDDNLCFKPFSKDNDFEIDIYDKNWCAFNQVKYK